MTIQSRIAEMKVLAAHLEQARQEGRTFSLSNFVRLPGAGVLVVSKDEVYSLVHDPMNGVLFLRLMELLNQLQESAVRRVYVIIDEFPMLCGDNPCPGIEKMLLLLRSRGVSVLLTYQAHASLKRIYGEEMANEIVGQTSNVIYLKQGDENSAKYAAEDLGHEWGYETIKSVGISGGMSGGAPNSSWNIQQNPQWVDRPIYSATELMNHLRPADAAWGVEGRVKCAAVGGKPFPVTYAPAEIAAIPKTSPDFENYMRRDPELGEDFKKYIELMRRTQRLLPLRPEEREALLKTTTVRPESEPWDTCQD